MKSVRTIARRGLPSVRREPRQPEANEPIPFSGVVSALSFALDLMEGQPMGHSLRSTAIGMRLGSALGLPAESLSNLYYGLLLKDVGCSSNASRTFEIRGFDDLAVVHDARLQEWTPFERRALRKSIGKIHAGRTQDRITLGLLSMLRNKRARVREIVQMRCIRGGRIAGDLGLPAEVGEAICSLGEMWNGTGFPVGQREKEISLLSRIMSVAQTIEVFSHASGLEKAIQVLRKRSGRWYDPQIVAIAVGLHQRRSLMHDLDNPGLLEYVISLDPLPRVVGRDDAAIDRICVAFAGVIDAKSHFTFTHSTGVAGVADMIGRQMGMSAGELKTLQRAALLHDIGKLSVPNSILEKKGTLTAAEWACIYRHPHYTYEVLRRIPQFSEIAEIACSHHEKLDGTGYPRKLTGDKLSPLARVLAVADRYDALSAERPYRKRLDPDRVFELLRQEVPHALDSSCVEALEAIASMNSIRFA